MTSSNNGNGHVDDSFSIYAGIVPVNNNRAAIRNGGVPDYQFSQPTNLPRENGLGTRPDDDKHPEGNGQERRIVYMHTKGGGVEVEVPVLRSPRNDYAGLVNEIGTLASADLVFESVDKLVSDLTNLQPESGKPPMRESVHGVVNRYRLREDIQDQIFARTYMFYFGRPLPKRDTWGVSDKRFSDVGPHFPTSIVAMFDVRENSG